MRPVRAIAVVVALVMALLAAPATGALAAAGSKTKGYAESGTSAERLAFHASGTPAKSGGDSVLQSYHNRWVHFRKCYLFTTATMRARPYWSAR